MDKVEEFFHIISPKLINLTNKRFDNTTKIIYKEDNTPNFATEGDLDNEKLIKGELLKLFPNDHIIAEETSSDISKINKGRVWIVDPICGSSNFQNGIKFFSTNIALALDGKLIASCVIDHSRGEYIWSTGNNIIYVNKNIIKAKKRSKGIVIEVDLSAVVGQSSEIIKREEKLIKYLLDNKKYYLTSFVTSLGFAYTALKRIDAYVNGISMVWDVAAANFLISQAGGIVTQTDGKPWTLLSTSVIASTDPKLHEELLDILLT